MRAIGIDPGTRDVGYGVVELDGGRYTCLDGGTIRTSPKKPLAERLVGLHRGLQVVLVEWRPAVAVVEDVFCGRNVETAIKIGEGRGVALLSAAEAEVAVVSYPPAQVKKAVCGNGRASKEQVQRAVAMLLGGVASESDHQSDALALALCHLNRARLGLPTGGEPGLPPAVLAALGGRAPRRRRRR